MPKNHPAMERILKQLREESPHCVLATLSPADINTLEMACSESIAARTSPGMLLNRYIKSSYAQEAEVDAMQLRRIEADVLAIAQEMGIQTVQLSPVAPLGACSVVGAVHQNKVISAVRGVEVSADPTNALALSYCAGVKSGKAGREMTHLCTTQRVVRAQPFRAEGQIQHFTMFAMISAGYDEGSYSFEKEALATHIALYNRIFQEYFHETITLRLRRMPGYRDGEGLIKRLAGHVSAAIPSLSIAQHPDDGTGEYYRGMQFNLLINGKERVIAIADGGITDWSQTLLSNQKQRMLISAFGIDRMLSTAHL